MTEVFFDFQMKQVPKIRYELAAQAGIKKIMMVTWGGLGDQVVAEPTLRYAFKLFPDHDISLLSSFPELFTHLPFKNVYRKEDGASLNEDEWLVFHTNPRHKMLPREFISHNFVQAVDFCSLAAFQRQLPIEDRVMRLSGLVDPVGPFDVVIHPGRHWSSKTFPKRWWNQVIRLISNHNNNVAIVGKDIDEETGTVDVEIPDGVADLRNSLNLCDLVNVLHGAKVVVTNDSAPLHMAASGSADIVFIASCKESDYLMHWRLNPYSRKVEFGYGMKNLGRTGIWDFESMSPMRGNDLRIDLMSRSKMRQVLPTPSFVAAEVFASTGFQRRNNA